MECMSKKNVLIVVGARPNFIKVTQFKRVAQNYPKLDIRIVHTSQHFSDEMSKLFFEELDLQPDYFLNLPENLSPIPQMAEMMKGLHDLITNTFKPDLMMVVGDVNSTLAGSLVANKMNIPLAHLESGLRSFDNTMPEEHNRVLTDKLAHYLFVTEEDAIINLKYEGIKENNIFFVGNTMIDTLVAYKDKICQSNILNDLNLSPKTYALITLHRPNNVDTKEGLEKIISFLKLLDFRFSNSIKHFVFPIHPRTENNFKKFQLWDNLVSISSLILTKPQSYFNFQKLIQESLLVITDSGGVQEETTFLQIPCITLRPTTERPITIWRGSNVLLDFKEELVVNYITNLLNTSEKNFDIPSLWDGKSTERVISILNKIL